MFSEAPQSPKTPQDRHPAQTHVKLPKIPIPVFDGDLKAWSTFFDLFKNLVHNNHLSDIEKFQHLIMSLVKEPLHLIRTLPLSVANYRIAFDSLTKRYQNKRLLANTYWSAVVNATVVTTLSAKFLRQLADTFSEVLAALSLLGFPIDD